MKKRLPALLLILCLLTALCAAPAAALAESDETVQTVLTLNIMTGDETGRLNLDDDVKRSEFAKLMVSASAYKSYVGTEQSENSPYTDVPKDHWAMGYIRLATQRGWLNGYEDGTFQPDNTIRLEEACTALLRLLGYTTDKLGAYPEAQLDKAGSVGLRKNLTRDRGDILTRADCAQMFYNLMLAENSKSKIYATTLGYTVTNGRMDLTTATLMNLEGPFIADHTALPFTPRRILLDGEETASYTLRANDVYYYHTGLRSAWVFTRRVSGKIESVTTSKAGVPTYVTVYGIRYQVGSQEAAYQLSDLAGTSKDSYVTLLLGMNNAVVGVLLGGETGGAYYGMVKSYTRASNESQAVVDTTYNVFCTDGVTRSFTVSADTGITFGTLVTAVVNASGVTLTRMPLHSLSGKVNEELTALGDKPLSRNVQVIETDPNGYAAAKVEIGRLAGLELTGSDVRSYTVDGRGNVNNLILNNVSGDAQTYGYLVNIGETKDGNSVSSRQYRYVALGRIYEHDTERRLDIKSGGIAVQYKADGTVNTMTQLTSVKAEELSNHSVRTADGKTIPVWENAQIYLQKGYYTDPDAFYLTPVDSINAADYTLTAWYDTCKAGGMVRVVIAVPKNQYGI